MGLGWAEPPVGPVRWPATEPGSWGGGPLPCAAVGLRRGCKLTRAQQATRSRRQPCIAELWRGPRGGSQGAREEARRGPARRLGGGPRGGSQGAREEARRGAGALYGEAPVAAGERPLAGSAPCRSAKIRLERREGGDWSSLPRLASQR